MNGGTFMKNWKKNIIAAAVLLTVCTGIYLNWRFSGAEGTKDLTDTLDAKKVMSDNLLVLNDTVIPVDNPDTTVSDYFAAVRLSRQKARDSAVSLLQEAMSYGEDSAQSEASSKQLEQLVQTALSEAQIESLVIAKGYIDCVAYMSEDGISVAVAAPEGGLQQKDVALIADIVMAQSEYTMDQIRVVEVP